eukprot:TRINITY_DN6623_c0_g1_i2.p1 TRINITY_DN6623_c0_g1~~TRINITY_DN6623_c0_g1_i2.p1  ORF type:complete len:183 (-),score=18.04 TRINITY_DN6623_c0_g1_i2:131-679(-)
MKFFVIAVLVVLASASYKTEDQCDKRWAYKKLGNTNTTICENYPLGSLMVSLTYFIKNRHKICSQVQEERWCYPNVFNEWLTKNDAWEGTTSIKFKALEKLNVYLLGCTTNKRQILKWYDEKKSGRDIIVNIHGGNIWAMVEFAYPDRVSVANPRDPREDSIPIDQVIKACYFENGNFGVRE